VDISGVGTFGFTRLAINGLTDEGMQPMQKGSVTWMCNGEIYNWRELAAEYGLTVASGSDCEVLGHLYERFADDMNTFFRLLDGVFALVIVDVARQRIVVGRDPYGVRPLYTGKSATKALVLSSEIKAMMSFHDVKQVLPGTYTLYSIGNENSQTIRYHSVPYLKNPSYSAESPLGLTTACAAVREALVAAVRKRITTTERPVACLLSGGLDSSLITSLVSAELRRLGRPVLKTFSIGMAGSTDLAYARKVADFLGTDHTEVCLTEDDFFRAIPAVIRDIESYDTTTVRASVGNWLVSREVARLTDCKVLFNGDGSDEVWGSYLYFKAAPSGAEFEEECRRLLTNISSFDVLRSDRSISSHGLEPRTPFLDREFVAVALSMPTAFRRPGADRPGADRPEKWLMRTAFDDGVTLPKEVLWRQKEAFSDGVSGTGNSWFEILQRRCAALVPTDWRDAAEAYGVNKPTTAEMFYYRYTFEAEFGTEFEKVNVPYFWMPKWVNATDPSARTLAVYVQN
jgi:asparagine synthase (glutamine-hydrolysing)